MNVPVSILIPIKNEAANLPRCLAAVAWADEIFVVDSNSTDGSQAIVEAFARKAEIGKVENRDQRSVGSGEQRVASGESENRSQKSEAGSPTDSASDPNFSFLLSEFQRLGAGETASGPSVKLVQFAFNGTWPKKKNWALENLPFKHEWVFILDADEVMPPSAEAEFRAIVSPSAVSPHGDDSLLRAGEKVAEGRMRCASGEVSPTGHPPASSLHPPGVGEEIAGYWINRRFMFMGQWLQHAYYPNWNLRLFKHRLGRYEKLTDVATASGDNEVHEHVVVQGQTGHLKCEMDHYAFPSVDVFVEKHNRYSNWEARVALDRALKGSSQSLQSKQVGMLRRLKQLSQRLPFRPLQRFLYVYLWQRGFLDGVAGWHFARLHALYEYLCVVKTVELKKTGKVENGKQK